MVKKLKTYCKISKTDQLTSYSQKSFESRKVQTKLRPRYGESGP